MLHGRADYNNRIQDTLHIIPEDEPVFLLRAQDVLALGALEWYLKELKDTCADADDRDNPMIESVGRQLARMEAWRVSHQAKMPDCPK